MTDQKKRHLGIIKKARRVVIKVGSSVLADPSGGLIEKSFRALARSLVHLIEDRKLQLVLVSSGAIACGIKKLGFKCRPHTITTLQACAAAGQPALMHAYERAFASHGLKTAQVLITQDDLGHRRRYINAKHTLYELLKRKVVPIINENDTVVVDEIKVGDNDTLAAHVATMIEADLLLMLTDCNGLFTGDPRVDPKAQRIPVVQNVDRATTNMASGPLYKTRIGGMETKLAAARLAGRYGTPTVIADGTEPKTLNRLFDGADCGTLFLPSEQGLKARKHWIAYTLKPAGCLVLDSGAARAIAGQGKSLLATGITEVRGKFDIGDPVDLIDSKDELIARGLVSYNSDELSRIKGCKSSEIEKILGYRYADEVIHRDDLAQMED